MGERCRRRGQGHSENLHRVGNVTVDWSQSTNWYFSHSTPFRVLHAEGLALTVSPQQHSWHRPPTSLGNVKEKGNKLGCQPVFLALFTYLSSA